jgi:Tol biopolymer transport system component
MAEVYRARDSRLNRDVAIKVLAPRFADDPDRLARLEREAQLLASLQHPRIAAIHGLEHVDQRLLLVLELVEGRTLAALLRSRALATEEALDLARQIAEALEAAHSRGIVHRDLKPANITVGADGSVKLLDFGLAKALVADPDSTGREPLTATGLIVGTAAYMSPEQARAQAVDCQTDIWSFGCVLYELLAGRPAFSGHTAADIVAAVLGNEPDWSALPSSTPFPVTQLIRRCLQKDRARRARDIADVRLEIEQVLEAADDMSNGVGRRDRGRTAWPWVLAVAVFAVVVGVAIVAPPWSSRPTETMRAETLTTFRGSERFPSLSPDGNYLTFMWTGPAEDNPDIYVQQIGAGNPLRLTSDARSDYNPVWSPDGKWVAFLRAERIPASSEPAGPSELRLIPPLGGAERKLGDLRMRTVGTPAFLAWCPDSACVIATDSMGEGRPDALFVFPLDTGERRQLTSPPDGANDCNPAMSPDGRSLVFRRVPAARAGELYWMPFGNPGSTGAHAKRLTPSAMDAAYPSWVPGGNEIVFAGRGTLWRLSPDSESTPVPLLLLGEHGVMPAIGQATPANVSRLVYVRSALDQNIWAVSTPDGNAVRPVAPRVAISSTRADLVGTFSPDGRRVVFASNRSGGFEIWTADPDGANAVQVSAMDSEMTSSPAWSPDGASIAFQSNAESLFDIYVIGAAGGATRRLTVDAENNVVPSFSRDGRWIYFASTRRANPTSADYQVWKVGVGGGRAVQVTVNGGFKAMEGPDGRFLYYTQAPRGALWRIPSAGGSAVKVLDEEIRSAFNVVENGIYYIAESSGQSRLQFLDFATNRSSIVADDLGRTQPFLAVAPDRRTILYTRVDASGDDLMLVNRFR